MKRIFMLLASVLILIFFTSCTPDQGDTLTPKIPEVAYNKGFKEVGPPALPLSGKPFKYVMYEPTKVPFPCKMVVINNNIQLLSRPMSGSPALMTLYKAGAVVTATKTYDGWVAIQDGFGQGWVHKDNLQPAS